MSQASEWRSSRVKANGCSSVSRMLMRPSVLLLLTFFAQVLRTQCRPANTDEGKVCSLFLFFLLFCTVLSYLLPAQWDKLISTVALRRPSIDKHSFVVRRGMWSQHASAFAVVCRPLFALARCVHVLCVHFISCGQLSVSELIGNIFVTKLSEYIWGFSLVPLLKKWFSLIGRFNEPSFERRKEAV